MTSGAVAINPKGRMPEQPPIESATQVVTPVMSKPRTEQARPWAPSLAPLPYPVTLTPRADILRPALPTVAATPPIAAAPAKSSASGSSPATGHTAPSHLTTAAASA
eukprot:5182845-Prorocentrum_lima.AAC.1